MVVVSPAELYELACQREKFNETLDTSRTVCDGTDRHRSLHGDGAAARAAPVGTVIGQVVSADSKAPIQGAQVSVLGTTLRASANAEGRFVLRNVPVGSHTLRVQMLGFAPKEQQVAVTAGGTATANFEMTDIPYAVAPVVVTALGIAREEKSLGYATTSISAQTLEKIPEATMMQALAGQSAGVAMTSGSGRPGAGARVVIRGEIVVQRHGTTALRDRRRSGRRPTPTVAAMRSAPGRREAGRWTSTWRTSTKSRS